MFILICGLLAANKQRITIEGTIDAINDKVTMKLRRGITMDSGAFNNVLPRRMVRDKTKIRESEGSRRGAGFLTASNGRLPNEGEVDFEFQTHEGDDHSHVFQIAEVNKALGAVSYFVDKDYRVVFDRDSKTGKDISHMTHKPSGQCTRFRRERNVWVLDAFTKVTKTEGFGRHA